MKPPSVIRMLADFFFFLPFIFSNSLAVVVWHIVRKKQQKTTEGSGVGIQKNIASSYLLLTNCSCMVMGIPTEPSS